MKGRTWAEIDRDRPMRHAVEIRHDSFATDAFVRLLRKYRIALVSADTAGKWPMLHDVTADFVYARLHGIEELYASGYTEAALDDWAVAARRAGVNEADGTVCCYPVEPGFIAAQVALIRDALAKRRAGLDYRLLFSAYPADSAGEPLGPSRWAPGGPYWLALVAVAGELAVGAVLVALVNASPGKEITERARVAWSRTT